MNKFNTLSSPFSSSIPVLRIFFSCMFFWKIICILPSRIISIIIDLYFPRCFPFPTLIWQNYFWFINLLFSCFIYPRIWTCFTPTSKWWICLIFKYYKCLNLIYVWDNFIKDILLNIFRYIILKFWFYNNSPLLP